MWGTSRKNPAAPGVWWPAFKSWFCYLLPGLPWANYLNCQGDLVSPSVEWDWTRWLQSCTTKFHGPMKAKVQIILIQTSTLQFGRNKQACNEIIKILAHQKLDIYFQCPTRIIRASLPLMKQISHTFLFKIFINSFWTVNYQSIHRGQTGKQQPIKKLLQRTL